MAARGMAGAPGFEPGITGPKPVALPLGYAPSGAAFSTARGGAEASGSARISHHGHGLRRVSGSLSPCRDVKRSLTGCCNAILHHLAAPARIPTTARCKQNARGLIIAPAYHRAPGSYQCLSQRSEEVSVRGSRTAPLRLTTVSCLSSSIGAVQAIHDQVPEGGLVLPVRSGDVERCHEEALLRVRHCNRIPLQDRIGRQSAVTGIEQNDMRTVVEPTVGRTFTRGNCPGGVCGRSRTWMALGVRGPKFGYRSRPPH